MSVLANPYFHDETAAFAHLEGLLWPEGPTCPHCGNADAKRITRLEGKATRIGVHKCNECRKQFTVKVGTVFESAHVPLHKMLQAVYLLSCSKKGCSAHQMHRILQVTYKTAWFLCHRIREAMRTGKLAPMGGPTSIVEIDETVIGKTAPAPKGRAKLHHWGRNIVLTLVERGGSARSFKVDSAGQDVIWPIIKKNVRRESDLMTDEGPWYKAIGRQFATHNTVTHSKSEYVRDEYIHSNTVENYYSIFKRGMKGIYQHCKEKHLHRYLAEFDFRYSNRAALGVNDEMRAGKALRGISGKRLTYRIAT
jgi:transposase-like protein